MNKRFLMIIYFIFLIFGCWQYSFVAEINFDGAPQKSLSMLKNELLAKFDAKAENLNNNIKMLEREREMLKSDFNDNKFKQLDYELQMAIKGLEAVQKKRYELEHVFDDNNFNKWCDWANILSSSIKAVLLISSIFITYKIYQKISLIPNSLERKRAYMLTSAVFGAFLFVSFLLYYFSRNIVTSFVGAEKLDTSRYAYVYKIAEDLCKKAEIAVPTLWIIDECRPNAFATGRGPSSSAVVFSKGILDLLNNDELESAMSHELSHVKNNDALIKTIFFVLSVPLHIFSERVKHSRDRGRAEIYKNDVNFDDISKFIIFRFLGVIMKLTLQISNLFVSRTVEYKADQDGAVLCGNPLGLASAIDKMRKSTKTPFFCNGDANLIDWSAELFSTHPDDRKRIKKLKEIDDFYRKKMLKIAEDL